MAIQTVPLVVLFQLFLCFTIKQINAGPQDPEYPELGENDRLANKIGWPKPAPYTAAGEEDKWHLALQSRSRLDCDFLSQKKYICNNAATKSTSVDTLTTEQACQEWCEDGVDSTPESSLEWHETAFCSWDNSNNLCTLEGCNQPIISSDSNYAYSACAQNNDFSYESPLWDTVIGDFVNAPDYTENACDQTVDVLRKDFSEIPNCWTKVNNNTKGRNLITEHYLNKQVTHVRIIMNGVDKIYRKHKDELSNSLRSHMLTRVANTAPTASGYDEIIVDNFIIKKVHLVMSIVDDDMFQSFDLLGFKNLVKHPKIEVITWDNESRLESYINKVSAKEKKRLNK